MSENSATNPELQRTIPWGGVTDPSHHDPHLFRYLVFLDSGRPIEANDKDPNSRWEYLLGDPSRIATAGLISASLVDQDHTALWQGTSSTHGFIIEVPEDGVVATSTRDMFTKGETEKSLKQKYPVKSPESILSGTPSHDHNEVLVTAERINVKAVFWVKPQLEEGESPYTREKVMELAQDANMPFLELDLMKY